MTKSEMVQKLGEVNAVVPGKKVRIDFGPEGAVYLDGVANKVSEESGDADATIHISWDDWTALAGGQLNPMTAFMSGKIRIDGDMGIAMQLQSVLGKLTG